MRGLLVLVPFITALLPSVTSTAAEDQRSENERRAILALQTINSAQQQYYSQFGHYADSLRQLGGRDRSGKSTPEAAGLIPPELASGVKNGYRFALESRGPAAYAASADPTVFGTTGGRTFFSDQSLVVHGHKGPEPATAKDPAVRQ